MHAQSISTDSETEDEEQQIKPKTPSASVEISNISQQHAALLRKSVFDTVACTVNVRRGAAAPTPSITLSEEGEADILGDIVHQLPPVPDTPIDGSQKVWFNEPIIQVSMPMVGGNVPPKIGLPYVELEPSKPADAPVNHPWPTPVLKLRNSQNVLKHSVAEAAEHSLQMVAQKFKNIHEPKIWKLRGGYSANAGLTFDSWLKDTDMCV